MKHSFALALVIVGVHRLRRGSAAVDSAERQARADRVIR